MNLATSVAGLLPPISSMCVNFFDRCSRKTATTWSIWMASSRVGVMIMAAT